jgi:hypothetical protein
MGFIVIRECQQGDKPLKPDIQSIKQDEEQSGKSRIKIGLKIAWNKKNHHAHGEMDYFSYNEGTNTQASGQKLRQKNKKEHETECEEKGWQILGQSRLKVQHSPNFGLRNKQRIFTGLYHF